MTPAAAAKATLAKVEGLDMDIPLSNSLGAPSGRLALFCRPLKLNER
jgi:hypothetical protein